MSQDTPEQARILRMKGAGAARKVRKVFPEGTRVAARAGARISEVHGTVVRHVPGLNAQGGYLLVTWDNGNTGRHGAISLVREDSI